MHTSVPGGLLEFPLTPCSWTAYSHSYPNLYLLHQYFCKQCIRERCLQLCVTLWHSPHLFLKKFPLSFGSRPSLKEGSVYIFLCQLWQKQQVVMRRCRAQVASLLIQSVGHEPSWTSGCPSGWSSMPLLIYSKTSRLVHCTYLFTA